MQLLMRSTVITPVVIYPRVMRLPGFLHQKVKNDGIRSEPFMTRIEQSHEDLAYAYDHLKEAFPSEGGCLLLIVPAVHPSGRRLHGSDCP